MAIVNFLKTSSGSINPAILADISPGQVVITAAYWEGSDKGGATYVVVGPGTGPDDGGSHIDAGSFQLQAVFDSRIELAQFGADDKLNDSAKVQAAVDYAESIGGAVLWGEPSHRYNLYNVGIGDGVIIDFQGGEVASARTTSGVDIFHAKRYPTTAAVTAGSAVATTSGIPIGGVLPMVDPDGGDVVLLDIVGVDQNTAQLAIESPITSSQSLDRGAVGAGIRNVTIDCLGSVNNGVFWMSGCDGDIHNVRVIRPREAGVVLSGGASGNRLSTITALEPRRHGLLIGFSARNNDLDGLEVVAEALVGHGLILDDRSVSVSEWDGVVSDNTISNVSITVRQSTPGRSGCLINGVRNTLNGVVSHGPSVGVLFSDGNANQTPRRPSEHNSVYDLHAVSTGGIGVQFQAQTAFCRVIGGSIDGASIGVLDQGGTSNAVSIDRVAASTPWDISAGNSFTKNGQRSYSTPSPIGDGVGTEFLITHNLGSTDVVAHGVIDATGQVIHPEVYVVNGNEIKLVFASAPASDSTTIHVR